MIFTLGAHSVELESPAQYPLTPLTELVQAKDKSASGITHVEDFEVQTDTTVYVFAELSNNDYVSIMSWFLNTANGMMNTFELTDDLGVTRTVRFTTPKISFPLNDFGSRSGSFKVESA